MDFDPNSITQEKLHNLRAAAETAWGDDTRHHKFEGHPNISAGQCYVTSNWLKEKLDGHVAVKHGHYVWLSPDKNYVIDLTGDNHASPPHDMRFYGARLDNEDEGWIPADHQRRWQPGPVVYTRASHSLYDGLRVKQYEDNPRAKLFSQRANQAYDGA